MAKLIGAFVGYVALLFSLGMMLFGLVMGLVNGGTYAMVQLIGVGGVIMLTALFLVYLCREND